MIRVNLGNRTLGVTFQREFDIEEIEKSTGDGSISLTKQGIPRATYCELHSLREAEVDGKTRWDSIAIVARSRALIATRGKRDQFSYETGRKIALARALKAYGLSRDARSQVWAAYLKRPRPISIPPVQAPADPVLILDEAPVQMSDATGFVEPFAAHHAAKHLHSLDFLSGEV